jgi:hypothetical protein
VAKACFACVGQNIQSSHVEKNQKVLFFLANDNRYEGEWKNDKKNGNGKFFFLNKGNLIEGFWVDDICKASQVIDFDRNHAVDPTKYELPSVSGFVNLIEKI